MCTEILYETEEGKHRDISADEQDIARRDPVRTGWSSKKVGAEFVS